MSIAKSMLFKGGECMDKEMSRGDTMLISISADDFPVTDLSDVVLTIKHGQTNMLTEHQ